MLRWMASAAKGTKDKEKEVTFKPRKVKKNEEKYRNRAEERRAGADHDYSQVRSSSSYFSYYVCAHS